MEPADFISLLKASILTFIHAVFGAALLFGVGLTEEQIGAVLVVVDTGLGILFLVLGYMEKTKTQAA